ncbi:MAG: alpha/beta hydrolase domain-containing protein [Bryobacteraceae bacterium]
MRNLCLLAGLLCASICQAALDHINASERSDVLGGASFGSAGPYERIVGKAYFQVDPKLPANRIIRDIDLAPKNAGGMVEFSADVYILKPRDPAKSNGTVLFEVSNRGGKGMLTMFDRAKGSPDPRSQEELGDKLLLEEGYTLVWLGWQFDVMANPQLMRNYVPVAKGVTGLVRAEIVPDHKIDSWLLADRIHAAFPVMDVNDPGIQLTVRDKNDGPRRVVPRDKWTFTDSTHISMKNGFELGEIYEVVYKSQDSPVAGLGFAGIRDLISFLKYGSADTLLSDQHRFLKRAIGFGTSQSGRVLRTFLYDGFNADEKNRRTFDALWPHVAGAGRGSFNHRFAQPSRDGQPFTNFFYPVDMFPFTDLPETDNGVTDSILARATAAHVVPKLFLTNGSFEYWGRAAALIHITPDGKADAPIGRDTRIYYNTAAQHGPGSFPPKRTNTRNLSDPLDYRYQMRGLLAALNAWVTDNKEPPPSSYPLIATRQLVPLKDLAFPKIGIEVPRRAHGAYHLDFGPEFRTAGIATIEPPSLGKPFPVMVPQVDADGNEVAGIRLPEVQVPLGTYTGWNQRAPNLGAPEEMIAFIGSFVPFARTKAERLKANDPRLSLEERYHGKQDYIAKISAAAKALAHEGYILQADLPMLNERAKEQWDYFVAQK